jgi:hypothetical protein
MAARRGQREGSRHRREAEGGNEPEEDQRGEAPEHERHIGGASGRLSPGRGIRRSADPGNAEAREPLAQFPGFDALTFSHESRARQASAERVKTRIETTLRTSAKTATTPVLSAAMPAALDIPQML